MRIDFLEGRQERKEGLSIALYTPKARLSKSSDQVSAAMVYNTSSHRNRYYQDLLIIPILFPNWPPLRMKALGFDL